MPDVDAVVVGSGPNGLVAATLLARRGWSVTVLERSPTPGGSVRSDELTLPGYLHDTHSAFYGLLHRSPVFAELGLGDRVAWARHEAPVGAVVGPGSAAVIHREPADTARGLRTSDPGDGAAWLDLWEWWRSIGTHVLDAVLAPLPAAGPGLRVLRASGLRGLADLAQLQLSPVEVQAVQRFRAEAARALVASGITHTDLGVDATGSTPAALVLALVAQECGMPVPVGGAVNLARGLVSAAEDAGAVVVTDAHVSRIVIERGRAVAVETDDGRSISVTRAVVADTGVAALCRDLVGEAHFPVRFLEGLRRFRHGTGMFKVDLALDGPVAWDGDGLDGCAVVHVTGDLDTMARSSFEARRGLLPAEPLLVVGQQSVADPSRAPDGCHTLWVETHVPPLPVGDAAGRVAGGTWASVREEFTERCLDRLEKHAPGLRDRVVGQAVRTPPDLETDNPNLVAGDIGGGTTAPDQQLVFRPVPGWFRYRTPVRGLYLCSASAHPGGGVHGMVGRNSARRVLADARIRRI